MSFQENVTVSKDSECLWSTKDKNFQPRRNGNDEIFVQKILLALPIAYAILSECLLFVNQFLNQITCTAFYQFYQNILLTNDQCVIGNLL